MDVCMLQKPAKKLTRVEVPLTVGRIRCAVWFEACKKVKGHGQARRGDEVLVLESCSIAGREMQGKVCLVRERVGNWLHLDSEIWFEWFE